MRKFIPILLISIALSGCTTLNRYEEFMYKLEPKPYISEFETFLEYINGKCKGSNYVIKRS